MTLARTVANSNPNPNPSQATHCVAVQLRTLARSMRTAGPPWVKPDELVPSGNDPGNALANVLGEFGMEGLWPVGHPERAREEARREEQRGAERMRLEREALGKVATTFLTMAEYLRSDRGADAHPAPGEAPLHDLEEAAQFFVLGLDILKGSLQRWGDIGEFERGLSALKALCEGPGGVEIRDLEARRNLASKIVEFEVPAARGQTAAPLVHTHTHTHTHRHQPPHPPACVSAVSQGRPFCVLRWSRLQR